MYDVRAGRSKAFEPGSERGVVDSSNEANVLYSTGKT